MLQKKDYQQQQNTNNKVMLQKKDYQQQQPTIKNVTKQEIPTTPNNKECYKTRNTNTIKTNATKEGLPTTTPTKIPRTPTKTNATKEGLPTTPTTTKIQQHQQKLMLQKKDYQQQHQQ